MELTEILKGIILGIIQGITEWLPISSTGHLVIVEDLMSFQLSEVFVSAFRVVVQLGWIFGVIVLFFNKLNPIDTRKTFYEKREILELWLKIIVATVPAAIVGFLFEDKIEGLLYNPITVASMLIIYGMIFIILESRKIKGVAITSFKDLNYGKAFLIGLFQMLALVPGTSRSGATIIGAVLLGTSRFIAAEFSFFLALPIMIGASGYKMLKLGTAFTQVEWIVLAVGSLTAFIVSVVIIKFLMDYIKAHDFKIFGYYRIIVGLVVLVYFYLIR